MALVEDGSRQTALQHEHGTAGVLGRLGTAAARHFRLTLVLWLVLIAGLGALAPQATKALAGAGWQADGSQSVQVRDLVDRHFGGTGSTAIQVVVRADRPVTDPAVRAVAAKATSLLTADPRITRVIQPQQGTTVSRDGYTEILLAGAKADANTMVRAADELKGPLAALSGHGVNVSATGSSVLWSDFNAANHNAMMHSEMMSWPVTMVILVIAFGSLVAAGLPLLLTVSGLAASAGALVLLDHLTPTSIWAMNFAMIFAIAMDYTVFLLASAKEHYELTGDPKAAVTGALRHSGRVVFAAAAVMVAVFFTFALSGPLPPKEMGVILGVAVFLDAALIRLVLLPVLLRLTGRAAWACPSWLARALPRIHFSHWRAEGPPATARRTPPTRGRTAGRAARDPVLRMAWGGGSMVMTGLVHQEMIKKLITKR